MIKLKEILQIPNRLTLNSHISDLDSAENRTQSTVPSIWPIFSTHIQTRLPVVVLFYSSREPRSEYLEPNSFSHLSTAARLNSLVVTFNYRLGLLGKTI